MWAARPHYDQDDDRPMDLRKSSVLQRDLENRKESPPHKSVYPLKENYERNIWHRTMDLPADNLRPFMTEKYRAKCAVVLEKYGGKCSVVQPEASRSPESKSGSRGTLETAIRRLHHNSQLRKASETPKEERCRSTDSILDGRRKNESLGNKRSSSCPNLTFIRPKPSSFKPKSTLIQRSCGFIYNETTESTNGHPHSEPEENSNYIPIGGAKKRKSFIPVYGDQSLSPKTLSRSPPDTTYNDRSRSPKKLSRSPPDITYSDRSYSPRRRSRSPLYLSYGGRSLSPIRRSRSPFNHLYIDRSLSPNRKSRSPPDNPLYDEYYSHPEILLRRQLQQHSQSPYFVHVYDYYQQLVQRLRDHSSPVVHLPSPDSPTCVDEDLPPDAQRKRPCRALTGKHVRQGTGASLSTLLTLRQKIQERQKAKEHEPRFNGNSNKNMCHKKNRIQKIKTKY